MGVVYEDLYDHEGYASGRAPRGKATLPRRRVAIDLYEAACSCGWTGACEYPLTEEGRELAIREWEKEHALPLLEMAVPASVAAAVEEAQRALRDLAGRRPRAARQLLERHARWVEALERELAADDVRRHLTSAARTRHRSGPGR